MSQNQSQTVIGVMNQMDGVNLHEKKGGRFKFRKHMTQSMSTASIEDLDLKPRAYNSLKRAGYNTIGDIVDSISSGNGLSGIRNCGKTSIREIMEHLFLYQYNSLPADKQDDYLIEVVMMNRSDAIEV